MTQTPTNKPMDDNDSLKSQLHRLIIENQDETGSIDRADQSAMADEIMELIQAREQAAERRGRIDENRHWYLETVDTSNGDVRATIWSDRFANRIAELGQQLSPQGGQHE